MPLQHLFSERVNQGRFEKNNHITHFYKENRMCSIPIKALYQPLPLPFSTIAIL